MGPHDITAISKERFGGDLKAVIEALCRLQVPAQTKSFNNTNEYVTAKLFVTWRAP